MAKKVVQKYNVAKNSDTMLVFHENPSHPVAFVSMQGKCGNEIFSQNISAGSLSRNGFYGFIKTHQF